MNIYPDWKKTAKIVWLYSSVTVKAKHYKIAYVLLDFLFSNSLHPVGGMVHPLSLKCRGTVSCWRSVEVERQGDPLKKKNALHSDVIWQGQIQCEVVPKWEIPHEPKSLYSNKTLEVGAEQILERFAQIRFKAVIQSNRQTVNRPFNHFLTGLYNVLLSLNLDLSESMVMPI